MRTILTLENRFGVLGRDRIGNEDQLANTVVNKKSSRVNVPKSEAIEDILENLTLSGRKKYIGKKITLNVKQLAVSNVLEMIADASGFNIIQPADVGTLPPLICFSFPLLFFFGLTNEHLPNVRGSSKSFSRPWSYKFINSLVRVLATCVASLLR